MGFRTVVMLSNDQAHEWSNDPELGKKISRAMNHANTVGGDGRAELGYGRVVECTHADCQTLAVLDGYTFFEIRATKPWARDESRSEITLKLLKEAARNLGYGLVKRRSPT